MSNKLIVKILIILYLAVLIFSFSDQVARAEKCDDPGSKDFSTGYENSFTFTSAGQARVNQKVTLTNLKSSCYAQVYTLTIGSDKITDVSGSDGLGSLTVTPKVQNGATSLVATLNQQVVGINKSVNFQINYTIDALAVKRGKVWNVSIPQIETGESLTNYKLSLITPKEFGPLVRVFPTPESSSANETSSTMVFGKGSLSAQGILADFGDFQEFSFTLKYRYKNSFVTDATASIALPPDTEYQALYYKSLEPRPVSMKLDQDGNYIATYLIKGGKSLEVTTTGLVRLSDTETPFQKPIEWSTSDLQKFTNSDKYIDSDNTEIQKEASNLKTVQDIYNFVSTKLKYDFTRIENNSLGRRGSLAALRTPEKSICTDYADLFVALARAKKIPARGLVGYAYTDNPSLRPTKVEGLVNTTILHAWAEYYDAKTKRWIQVDPTWGSTTGGVDYFNRLDSNHFVFTINGTQSDYPLPAGAYKTSSGQVDDVNVAFTNEVINISPNVSIKLGVDQVISGFASNSKLTISNKTGRAVFRAKLLSNSTSNLNIIAPKDINLGTILPFENETLDLKLRSNSLFDNENPTLNIVIQGTNDNSPYKVTTSKKVAVKPFFSLAWPQLLLTGVVLVVVAGWAYPRFHPSRKNLETTL